jgi:uncharacterized C2H2 Zn-finger protein
VPRDTTKIVQVCPYCNLVFYGHTYLPTRHIAKSHPDKAKLTPRIVP